MEGEREKMWPGHNGNKNIYTKIESLKHIRRNDVIERAFIGVTIKELRKYKNNFDEEESIMKRRVG